MSEPSGDTPNPPPATPPPDPTRGVLPVAPRANPPSVFNQKATPPAPEPPGFKEFAEWMRALSGGTAEETPATAGRPLISKDQKKFSRKTLEITPPPSTEAVQPVATPEASPSQTSSEKTVENASVKAPLHPLQVPLVIERKRRESTAVKSPMLVLLTQCLVFVLLIGSFFLGRATVPKNVTPKLLTAPAVPVVTQDGKTSGILPAALASKIDQANSLQSKGDYKGAVPLLEDVQQQGGYVYGMDYHLALINYAAGDLPRVILLLNKSIAEGEEVAASYNLRGTLFNRQGVNQGLSDLKLAAQLDPFDAKYAFFVGEALRRQGKPQAAMEYLQQAVDRLNEPYEEGIYRLKYRLALLEAGREQEFTLQLEAKLMLNPPPVDWLFTAAAAELHRGNIPGAAGFLDKAQAQISREEMNARLRDYYFYSFAQEKGLARFFAPLNQRSVTTTQPSIAMPTSSPSAFPSFAPSLNIPAAGTVPGSP